MTSKKSPGLKFAKLELRMVYSKAYQDLNAPSLKILSYLLLQIKWVNVSRSKQKPDYRVEMKDDIELLYSTFKNSPFDMNNSTISRAIDSLLAHGFCEVKTQGGRCKGHKTLYSYSDAWKSWEPGDVIFKRKPFESKGFCNV